ncbi:MAG: GTPase ObgE [Actinobacteria bacterium]|nr:GTPase ObgE [Actinomycetota bacterium]
MFRDHAKIHVAAGRGGDGSTSFRREKHVPRGGPDGGDGGPGGDVWAVADPQLRDLGPFARKVHFKAVSGRHGEGSRKNGAAGTPAEISVPLGTQVFRDGGLLADLIVPGQRVLLAEGGMGGRGNARFATSSRQSPRFCELGGAGEERWIELSLKLMADVGLAGLPNAGKSSLLRRVSNATPKVADYPFTTIEPLLGVVEALGVEEPFTVADVPGLLEGASEGVGMGMEFLAHLERCHLLLQVVEIGGYNGQEPLVDFEVLLGELEAGESPLAGKPRIVVLNKSDLLPPAAVATRRREFLERVRQLKGQDHPGFVWELDGEEVPEERLVWVVSAATGDGLAPLLTFVGAAVAARRELLEATGEAGISPLGFGAAPSDPGAVESSIPGHVVFRPAGLHEAGFTVRREGDGFVVEGDSVAKLVRRFDLDNDQAVRYLGERLERMGVYEALRNEGAQLGDDVEIEGLAFEYQ